MRKVSLVQLMHPGTSHEQAMENMIELESLVNTCGGLVVEKTYQKKSHPDYHTYIGNGKLEEIGTQMLEDKTDLLIIGNQLKPSQVWHIIRMYEKDNIEVRDRVDLILKIFEKHAVSAEAKLQIELAAIKHMGPRIFGMGMELSRQGGGTSGSGGRAGRGIGETNTERMRRHLKDREKDIRGRLAEYAQMRGLHRASRQRKGLATIGIVGYTNAGKGTLFNALCNKKVLAEDKLFATLGTHVGKIYIGNQEYNQDLSDFSEDLSDFSGKPGKEILINDTIGFIQDLPPELIDAFASTLEDSIESDILLHVIDASDPKIAMKIQVVNGILDRIGAKQPRILVFNKIDLIENMDILTSLQSIHSDAIYISAGADVGLERLKEEIVKKLG